MKLQWRPLNLSYSIMTCTAAAVATFLLISVWCVIAEDAFTREFAVHVRGGRSVADALAEKYGYINHGQIGSIDDHYLFTHQRVSKRSAVASNGPHTDIEQEPEVEWFEQQVSKTRVKRSDNGRKLHHFTDPLWTKQWYLDGNFTHNPEARPTASMNIQRAWNLGYTGHGVVVSIMDDGLEYTHTDIASNYDPAASYDYVSRDSDPTPRYIRHNEENMHGTRCAGEIVMQPNNSKCGVGIAYDAHIGGIRMLDGGVTDNMEASSLGTNPQHIDIFSASWGPDDGGSTVEGPAYLARRAMENGVSEGRGGKGSIFVWASGNGGIDDDDCNADGYANSIYTLVVSSTTEHQTRPFYSEHCAASLATTFSSGGRSEKKVLSTDLHNDCMEDFTGTSASAPIAAGICALALEANGNLTWRDLQYLVVVTSKRHQLAGNWVTNGAGYDVSHWFGFGLMDAGAMVEKAKTWETIPQQYACTKFADTGNHLFSMFTRRPSQFTSIINIEECKDPSGDVTIQHLEHVQLTISAYARRRGNIVVKLTSPSGTQSTLLSKRNGDRSRRGFSRWTLMSVHFWGENPTGEWTLRIGDGTNNNLIVKFARLTLRGTSSLPASLLQQSQSIPDEEFEEEVEEEENREDIVFMPGVTDDQQRQRRAAGWNAESDSWDSSWDSSWWWSSSDYFPFDQCHEECLYGCDGPNADDCYKCAHYKDRESMKCVKTCPTGQFSPPELHVRCGKCSRHCEKCSGPKPSDCLTCPNGKYLSNLNTCINSCGSGYYADEFFKLCRQCAPLCTSCTGNENTCTGCIPGAVLRGSQCITRCMDSEYLDGTQCQPCDPSCFSCNGPSEHECTACYDDYVHKDMTCVRPNLCGEGFYITNSYDASLRQCLRCHSTCKTCQGPSFTQCLTCRPSTFFAGGACLQTCENGKYLDDTGKCMSCSDGCIVCSDCYTCVQCDARRVLWRDESNNVVCEEGCPDGHFSQEGKCFSCHSSCETCNGGGIMDCTSCTQIVGTPKYLLEGACVGYCPYGYFSYERDHTCEQCDDSCKRCTGFHPTDCLECMEGLNLVTESGRCIEGTDAECNVPSCDLCTPGNADICQTCIEGSYLEGGSCMESCPDGKFPNPRQHVCELCHPSCKTCESESDQCTSCDDEYYLDRFDSMCVTECPEDTYVSAGDNVCLDCHDKCWTCNGPDSTDCTSCYEITEFLSGTQCIEQCPDGQYGDEYTGTCRSCHPSCGTCSGPGDHECLSCPDHFELTEGFCRSTCSGNSYTDPSTSSCMPCHESCQTCTGSTSMDCLSCNYYNFLDNQNKCVPDCPENYYPDYESNVCRPCHESCATCLDAGPEDCIECSSSTYMLLRSGQLCVDTCPEGFYESDELHFRDCRQCSIECRDCRDTYLNCISCHDGTYLYQERCFSTCPSGYEEDASTNHCIQRDRLCPLFCQECDDWGDCTTCEDNYVEYFGECVWEQSMACHTTQYIAAFNTDGTANCEPCHESCATCLGPTREDCVSCHLGYHFKGSKCVEDCGDGMYQENDKCYDCHPTCATCDNGSALDCTSCNEGMRLTGGTPGMCNSGCPDGTYAIYGSEDLGEVTACQSCHGDECTACFGPEKADCLTCKLGYFREENGSCVQRCPMNTYEYIQDGALDGNECRSCHTSCETCIGPSAAECRSCHDQMVHLNGQCLWDCDEGYYADDQKVCQRCNETCQTCDGPLPTNCLSCKVDQVVQDHVCVSSCEDGFFAVLSPTPTCKPCDPSCESCSDYGPFDCTSCMPNYELQEGVCYNRCGSGRYYDSKSKQCGLCSTDCLECFGPSSDQCIFCKKDMRLDKMNKNHSQCIPCCSGAEPDVECCDLCEPDNYKCTKPHVSHPKPGGVVKVDHIGVIVFTVIVVIILFFIVFGLLQARSNGRLCWRHHYDNVPAYSFNTKDNKYVTLGKPSDDYYEEDIYGEVSDDDEDDMLEEPDTFQTMGTPYRGQADQSLDKNGVIDHL